MEKIYLLLGANLGDPIKQLQLAIKELSLHLGPVKATSSLYESEAWGVTDQPNFYNQIVSFESDKNPKETLAITQSIENKLGRIRKQKWGARVIDIDILYFGMQVIHEIDLVIPHPYIQDRRFTLLPLVEIAPTYIHPILNLSNQYLLQICADNLKVKRYVNK